MSRISIGVDSSEEEIREFFHVLFKRLIKGHSVFDETLAPEKQPKRPLKKIQEDLKPWREAMERPGSVRENVEAIVAYATALRNAYPKGTPVSHAAEAVLVAIANNNLRDKTELDSRELQLCEVFWLLLWNLPLADVGVRPVSGGHKAIRVTHGEADKRKLKKQGYRAKFAALREKHPALSKEQCYKIIAQRSGVSMKTIKRAVLEK